MDEIDDIGLENDMGIDADIEYLEPDEGEQVSCILERLLTPKTKFFPQ